VDHRSLAYADREAFSPGSLVIRPDGSMFTQGDLSTYRRITIALAPASKIAQSPTEIAILLESPDIRKVDRPGTKRQGLHDGALPATSRPVSQGDAVPYDVVKRTLKALWTELTVRAPGGQEIVLRRLRHSSQGRGW
jgi:hypothetical protein